MNKNLINKILRRFGAEVHGLGYLEKQARSSFKNDPFQAQIDFFDSKKVGQVFDVGANVGNVTAKYTKAFPEADIHAFEPIPQAINQFKSQHKGNSKVHLNEMGLSNQKGEQVLNINKSIDTSSLLKSKKIGASSDKSCETVEQLAIQLSTIDDYVGQKNIQNIDILKLDTQGSELNILKGAVDCLKKGKIGLIFTEIYFKEQYENQASFYEIASFLKQYNYQLKDMYELYYNEKQILWGDAIFVHASLLD